MLEVIIIAGAVYGFYHLITDLSTWLTTARKKTRKPQVGNFRISHLQDLGFIAEIYEGEFKGWQVIAKDASNSCDRSFAINFADRYIQETEADAGEVINTYYRYFIGENETIWNSTQAA